MRDEHNFRAEIVLEYATVPLGRRHTTESWAATTRGPIGSGDARQQLVAYGRTAEELRKTGHLASS